MRRRSKETFKKEYALFKGGYEEFGKLRENPAIGTTSHRVVDKVLGELQARASLLDAINKEYEKKNPEPAELDRLYNNLRGSNEYFAKLSVEQRKEIESVFEGSTEPTLVKNKYWHLAYGAFLSTESLRVNAQVQKTASQLSQIEKKKKDLVQAYKKAQHEQEVAIKNHPDIDFKTFKKDLKDKRAQLDNLDKQLDGYKPKLEIANEARAEIEGRLQTAKNEAETQRKAISAAEKKLQILKEIIDLVEQNKEAIKTAHETVHAVYDEYKEEEKVYNDYKKDYNNAKSECNEKRKLIKDLTRNASPAMKQRRALTERIWALRNANNLIDELIASDGKYESYKTMRDWHMRSIFATQGLDYIYDDKPDIKSMWHYTREEFGTWVDEKIDSILEAAPAIEQQMTEDELNAFREFGSEYGELYSTYEDELEAYKEQGIKFHKIEAQYRNNQQFLAKLNRDLCHKFDEIGVYNRGLELFPYDKSKNIYSPDWTYFENLKKEYDSLLTTSNIKKEKEQLEEKEKMIAGIQTELDNHDLENKELRDKAASVQSEYDTTKQTVIKYETTYFAIEDARNAHEEFKRQKEELKEEMEKVNPLREAIIESIKANAASSLRKKAYRQGTHKNSVEYDTMIIAQEAVAQWPNADGKDVPKFDTMEDALKNLETQANKYLKAKAGQIRPLGTLMRTTRILYAKALVADATRELEDLLSVSPAKQKTDLQDEKVNDNTVPQKDEEPNKAAEIAEAEAENDLYEL